MVRTESRADPEVRAAVDASWLLVTFDPFTADPAAVRRAIGRLPPSPGGRLMAE